MTRTVGKKYGGVAALALGAVLTGCGGGSSGSPSSAPPPEPSKTTPAAPVLSDTGLGELKLGMTLKQARATGLLGKLVNDGPADDICAAYNGKGGAETVFVTKDQVVIITVGPDVRTDTGIKVGNTYRDLRGAYGDRLGRDGDLGRLYVTAPGAPFTADYRFGVYDVPADRDSKITEIALQSREFGCYE